MPGPAIAEDRLLLAYQPVVSTATGAVDYFESLLRLRNDAGGIVTGGDFVAGLERLGLIGYIDHLVLERSVEELKGHPEVRLGFNVSGLTVANRDWLRRVTSLLREDHGLAGRLVIEITETAALYDLVESARFVEALREAGSRVALDDFGAGHYSLRHLERLAVDTVKIDGSFVRELAVSPEHRVFLRHLLSFARGYGCRVVAEWVESAEDAAILEAEGVGFVQGYHFGRPTLARPWLGETVSEPPAGETKPQLVVENEAFGSGF
jgi:EAL domain-containing protein (putative c-di-GMP-specific phosphodiesterase class I)